MSKSNNTKILTQEVLNSTKTTRPNTVNIVRKWYVLDASKDSIGRLATLAATILMGKNTSNFAKDIDTGSCLAIINCSDSVLTGQKSLWKTYFTHSGRPGGLKAVRFNEYLKKDPTKPMYLAIKRMLPDNKMRSIRINHRLRLFPGEAKKLTQNLIPAN